MYFKKKSYLRKNITFKSKVKPILSIVLVTLLPSLTKHHDQGNL